MRLKTILISTTILFASTVFVFAQSQTHDLLHNAQEKAKAISPSVTVPDYSTSKGQTAAEKAAQFINSQDFQNRLKNEEDRVRNTFYPSLTEKILEHNGVSAEDKLSKTDKLSNFERIYILVSSSMPQETLRNYVQAVDQLNDSNIIIAYRGFIDGVKDYTSTVAHISGLLKKDPGCQHSVQKLCDTYKAAFNVDPLVFRKFAVTQVPAVIYADNVIMNDADKSIGTEDNLSGPITSHIIYGDASLQFILERLSKITGHAKFNMMAKKLNGGFYEERD